MPYKLNPLTGKLDYYKNYKPVISKTYAQLLAMIAAESLVVGQQYRTTIVNKYLQPVTGKIKVGIYDYATLTPEQLAEVEENVIFTANSTNTFEPWAESLKYAGHLLEFDMSNVNCINDYYNFQGDFGETAFYDGVGTIVKDVNGDYYVLKVKYSVMEPLSNTDVWNLIGNETDLVRQGRIKQRRDIVNNVTLPFDYKQTKFATFFPSYKQVGDAHVMPFDIPEMAGAQFAGFYYKYFDGAWKIWFCLRDNTDVTPAIPNFIPIHNASFTNDEMSSYFMFKEIFMEQTGAILQTGNFWVLPDFSNYKEFFWSQQYEGTDETIVDNSASASNVEIGAYDDKLYPYVIRNTSGIKNVKIPEGVRFFFGNTGGYSIEVNDVLDTYVGGEVRRIHVNKNTLDNIFAFKGFGRCQLNRANRLYFSDEADLNVSYGEMATSILMGGDNQIIRNNIIKGLFELNIINDFSDNELDSIHSYNKWWGGLLGAKMGYYCYGNTFEPPFKKMIVSTDFKENIGIGINQISDGVIGQNVGGCTFLTTESQIDTFEIPSNLSGVVYANQTGFYNIGEQAYSSQKGRGVSIGPSSRTFYGGICLSNGGTNVGARSVNITRGTLFAPARGAFASSVFGWQYDSEVRSISFGSISTYTPTLNTLDPFIEAGRTVIDLWFGPELETGNLVAGLNYEITATDGGLDFTQAGAPDNNVGTKFVSTSNTFILNSTNKVKMYDFARSFRKHDYIHIISPDEGLDFISEVVDVDYANAKITLADAIPVFSGNDYAVSVYYRLMPLAIYRSEDDIENNNAEPMLMMKPAGGMVVGDIANGNHSEFEETGFYKATGDAEAWDDVQFQISSGKPGMANVPTWEAFTTSTSAYSFAVNDYIDLGANEPFHGWKIGTDGSVHLHITTKAANNSGADMFAKFQVVIAYADVNAVWQETTLTAELTVPNGTAALHNFLLPMGSFASGGAIGMQIKPRIKRIAATGGTEYASSAFITQLGIHFLKDTIGSREVATK